MTDITIQRLSGTLIAIGDKVRVEQGPLLIELPKATPEILSNAATASHYHRGAKDKLGRTIVIDEYEGDVYGPDRLSKFKDEAGNFIPIPNSGDLISRGNGALVREGQPFAYLDWMDDSANWPWHIYEYCTEVEELPEGPTEITRWRRRGYKNTEGEAMAAGGALAAQLSQ